MSFRFNQNYTRISRPLNFVKSFCVLELAYKPGYTVHYSLMSQSRLQAEFFSSDPTTTLSTL